LVEAAATAVRAARKEEDISEVEGEQGSVEAGRRQRERGALTGFEGSGLYVCCALSNHSCRPNFTIAFDANLRLTMTALRDIEEGEELNLAYVSPSYDLSERLTSLWRNWGFLCTCHKCQDELMAKVLARRPQGSGNDVATAIVAAVSGCRASTPPPFLSPAGMAAAAATVGCWPPALSLPATLNAAHQGAPQLAQHSLGQEGEDGEQSVVSSEDDDSGDNETSSEEESGEDQDSDLEELAEAAAAATVADEDAFEGVCEVTAYGSPYGCPRGPGGVPHSVLALEEELRRFMATTTQDAEATDKQKGR